MWVQKWLVTRVNTRCDSIPRVPMEGGAVLVQVRTVKFHVPRLIVSIRFQAERGRGEEKASNTLANAMGIGETESPARCGPFMSARALTFRDGGQASL